MARLHLTRKAALDWIGSREFGRGEEYADRGDVSRMLVQGDRLKAHVQGTSDRPYRVEITIRKDAVAAADCSCPVGEGGRCKHVGAVLAHFLSEPDGFAEIEPLDTELNKREKAELVALIKIMVKQSPDLESLLSQPVPGGKRKQPADPKVYRRRALQLFREIDPYAEFGHEPFVDGLDALAELGEQFEQAGDAEQARAVFEGVAGAMTEDAAEALDGYGFAVVDRVCGGLIRTLAAGPKKDAARREATLKSILGLFVLSAGDELLDHILPAISSTERRTLAGWTRQLIRANGRAAFADYRNRRLGVLLLRIDADASDDETYLAVCHDAGMSAEYLARLLKLRRAKDAVAFVESRHGSHEFFPLCDALVAAGHGDATDRLVRSQRDWAKDLSSVRWLRDRAAARRDAVETLRLAETEFRLSPTVEGFRDVESQTPREAWPQKREQLLAWLVKEKRDYLFVPIWLGDGEVRKALDYVAQPRAERVVLDVARAAEKEFPAEAAARYHRAGVSRIAERNRAAYQEACRSFGREAALREKLGEAAAFRQSMLDLTERNKSLRALTDEMRKARLK